MVELYLPKIGNNEPWINSLARGLCVLVVLKALQA